MKMVSFKLIRHGGGRVGGCGRVFLGGKGGWKSDVIVDEVIVDIVLDWPNESSQGW